MRQIVLLSLAILSLPSCGGGAATSACAGMIGAWSNSNGNLRADVTAAGDKIAFQITNPTGLAAGNFSGPCEAGRVTVGGLLGDIVLSPNGQLQIAGESLIKTQ